jgi:hypothetical protein
MSANIFLTKPEIKELTGYSYKRKQCRELARLGIRFMVNSRFGDPIVLLKELEEKACSGSMVREPSINLEALKGVSNG